MQYVLSFRLILQKSKTGILHSTPTAYAKQEILLSRSPALLILQVAEYS